MKAGKYMKKLVNVEKTAFGPLSSKWFSLAIVSLGKQNPFQIFAKEGIYYRKIITQVIEELRAKKEMGR